MQAEKVKIKDGGFISKNLTNKEKRAKKDQEELDALMEEFEGEEGEEENSEDSGGEEDSEKDTPKDSEEATWKKRHGDLRRHTQKREQELKDEIDELKKAVESLKDNSEPSDLPEDEKELQEWMAKNPDAAKLINMMASKIADEKYSTLQEELESVKVSQEAVGKDKAVAKIMKAHPDFEDLQNDDKFHDWVESQPVLVQTAVYESTDPDSVIWAISHYKDTLKPKGKKKDTSAADSIDTRGKTQPTTEDKGKFLESDVAKMDQKTFEKNFEKIEKAIKDGTFVYDISGAAR